MTNTDLIIVHAPCRDGYTAALCARLWYQRNSDVVDTPNRAFEIWGLEPNKETCQKEIERLIAAFIEAGKRTESIRIFDLSIAPCHLNTLVDRLGCNNIQVYDHHLSFHKEWHSAENAQELAKWGHALHYDVEHCGAYLAWKYYFPEKSEALPTGIASDSQFRVPRFVLYIEDRDLWRFTQPNSNEVSEALFASSPAFDNPQAWLDAYFNFSSEAVEDEYFTRAAQTGVILLSSKQKRIETLYRTGHTIVFKDELHPDGLNVFTANCNHLDSSDLGNYATAVKGHQAAFLWRFNSKTKKIDVSTRSDNMATPQVDVSALCKQFGGGGHKNAAGFEINVDQLFIVTENS